MIPTYDVLDFRALGWCILGTRNYILRSRGEKKSIAVLKNCENATDSHTRTTRDYYCITRSLLTIQRFRLRFFLRFELALSPSFYMYMYMCSFNLLSYSLVCELMFESEAPPCNLRDNDSRQFSTCHLQRCCRTVWHPRFFRSRTRGVLNRRTRRIFVESFSLSQQYPWGPRLRGKDPRPRLFSLRTQEDGLLSSSSNISLTQFSSLPSPSLFPSLDTHMATLHSVQCTPL